MLKNYAYCTLAILFIISGCAFAAAGTREDPLPIGTSLDLGDGWTIAVLSVTPDATEQILQENMFNDPPAAGNQFFMARIRASYNGPDSDEFGGRYRLRAVGSSALGYSCFENNAGVTPDRLPDSELFTGASIEGNIAWEIKSSDAESLVMYDSKASKIDRQFMALYVNRTQEIPASSYEVTAATETNVSGASKPFIGPSYAWAGPGKGAIAGMEDKNYFTQETNTTDSIQQTSTGGPFVASSKSDKYHYPSCRSAKNIKEENKIWFATSAEARAAGYSPCSICSPP